ncbi:hypothetical protein M3Y99_01422200 [Aphelenchoides fujianensis]|nr:hypothetical protein M3Y99_01422200 [Aphelenchoides fujianensis]
MSALKYTACALVVVLLLPLGVLLLGACCRPSSRCGAWAGVWLEDFAAIARPQPQPAVRSLDFSVSLAGGLDGDLGQLHAFYGRCARNLRRAAPRLRWIGWNGGYVFNPENGTAQELEDELRLLHAHLAFLSATAARFGWELGAFDFHAVLVAEPAVVRAAHLAPLLRELFGRAPTAAEERARKRPRSPRASPPPTSAFTSPSRTPPSSATPRTAARPFSSPSSGSASRPVGATASEQKLRSCNDYCTSN